jgi:hypothetical protein
MDLQHCCKKNHLLGCTVTFNAPTSLVSERRVQRPRFLSPSALVSDTERTFRMAAVDVAATAGGLVVSDMIILMSRLGIS